MQEILSVDMWVVLATTPMYCVSEVVLKHLASAGLDAIPTPVRV
jgi:hypothetical protein